MSIAPAYTASPACRLVATRCAVCGRPLVDVDSVEAGIGPDCRARYGYAERQARPDWEAFDRTLRGTDWLPGAHEQLCDARSVGTWLVWRIATGRDLPQTRLATVALWHLGYRTLARKLALVFGAITVDPEGEMLVVYAPYHDAFAPALRLAGCPSRWDGDRKRRLVPASARRLLWRALGSVYRGRLVVGPRGIAPL